MDNNNNINSGNGVFDDVKANVNDRTKGLAKMAIDAFFDSLEDKVKDLPEAIKKLRNNQDIEQEMVTLWSEQLFKEGLVPNGYKGLPNNLLISNFHQEGYLDGLYVGYILAMMALVDNNASKDIILAIRDSIRPNLIGQHYNNRDDFTSKYKDEKYNWIDKT